MKNILCFGDSNTYGSIAGGGRFERTRRWPGILQLILGEDFHIIEEGCGGRTTVFDDPIEEDKNGKKHLKTCIHSHWPLDLVVLMLGTNDLKDRFSLSPVEVQAGLEKLVVMIQTIDRIEYGVPPRILIVSPIQIGKLTELESILRGAREKCEQLPALYRKLAEKRKTYFLDAGEYASADPGDGVHIDAEGHQSLAKAMAAKILSIFEERAE